ncbi:MAG TPA: hypothetical protein VFM46_06585 [Pseudomonadales bacterium]|nr:hypothetical protein [Pseudomonadales bacterium]
MDGNVFTYNQFLGSPDVNSIGLPNSFPPANLPTSVPEFHGGPMGVENQALADMHIRQNQAAPSVGITELYSRSPATPAKVFVPAKPAPTPSLWRTVGQAIIGGSVRTSVSNSSAALVQGTGPLAQQVAKADHIAPTMVSIPQNHTTF